jgi:hypothetical protein
MSHPPGGPRPGAPRPGGLSPRRPSPSDPPGDGTSPFSDLMNFDGLPNEVLSRLSMKDLAALRATSTQNCKKVDAYVRARLPTTKLVDPNGQPVQITDENCWNTFQQWTRGIITTYRDYVTNKWNTRLGGRPPATQKHDLERALADPDAQTELRDYTGFALKAGWVVRVVVPRDAPPGSDIVDSNTSVDDVLAGLKTGTMMVLLPR